MKGSSPPSKATDQTLPPPFHQGGVPDRVEIKRRREPCMVSFGLLIRHALLASSVETSNLCIPTATGQLCVREGNNVGH